MRNELEVLALLKEGPMTILELYRHMYTQYLKGTRPYEAMGGCRARLNALVSRGYLRKCRLKRPGDAHYQNGYYRVKEKFT